MKLPVVAIVGRPNVGKSTLFNRLTDSHRAITAPEPGVTRDRHVAEAEWQGRKFLVMDTGGWVPTSDDLYETAIREQVEFALSECDAVVLVVDAQTGPTDIDLQIAHRLQRSSLAVFLVVNKTDGPRQDTEVGTFYSLGLGEIYPLSAISGRAVADFLDLLLGQLPERGQGEEIARPRPLVAIVGRPNVGKSSLVNAVAGKPLRIVTEMAGTTRDAIDTEVSYYGQSLTLIDTAGLRRQSRVKEAVEFYTTVRTQRALRECDVAVVLTDAQEDVVAQDIRILQEAEELGKGMLLCINKWDRIEKDSNTAVRMERDLNERFATLAYVPKLFISATDRQRVFRVIELVLRIHEERQKRIATPELNRFTERLMAGTPPPSVKGRDVRLHYATQPAVEPPLFIFWTTFPDLVTDNYRRFLERKLREQYGFDGVPIRLGFRKKS